MKKSIHITLRPAGLIFITLLLALLPVFAYPEEIVVGNKEIIERLTKLEEGQVALNKRIDDVNKRIGDTNKRIDDFRVDTNRQFDALRADTNRQFDTLRTDTNRQFDTLRVDIDRRFDEMMFWLELVFGGMMLILAGIFAQGILLWRRQTRTETLLEAHIKETERDRLISFQTEEIKIIKEKMDKLEQKIATIPTS
jgi:peptidoglycan hydrolase CwlO-like protein